MMNSQQLLNKARKLELQAAEIRRGFRAVRISERLDQIRKEKEKKRTIARTVYEMRETGMKWDDISSSIGKPIKTCRALRSSYAWLLKNRIGKHLSLDSPTSDLDLSVRASNIVFNTGSVTIRQLITLSRYELSKYRNCGEIVLEEIHQAVIGAGINWPNYVDGIATQNTILA